MGRHVTVYAEVDARDVLQEADTEDIVKELQDRGKMIVPEDEPLTPEQIAEWFKSPFVSDFDKNRANELIKKS